MNENSQHSQTVNQLEDNDINLKASNNALANSNNQQAFTEDKAFSQQAFSQTLNSHSSKLPASMEKNHLFETFLLFQQFINSNPIAPQGCPPNQIALSKSTENNLTEDKETNEIEGVKDRMELCPLENNDNQYDTSRNGKSNQGKEAKAEGANVNNNNYDEVPIKTSNANFMELFEKSLAKDNQTDTNRSSQFAKERKAKAVSYHPKKKVQVSKPSKSEKKYFYYTDTLDENGKLIEDKKQKTIRAEQLASDYTAQQPDTVSDKPKKIIESGVNDDNINNKVSQKSSTEREDIESKVMKSISPIPSLAGTSAIKPVLHQSKNTTSLQHSDNDPSAIEGKPNDDYVLMPNQPIHTAYSPQVKQTLISEEDSFKNEFKEEPKENKAPQMSNRLYEDNRSSPTSKEQIIEAKIEELNQEIAKFKQEKEKVDKLKAEYEKLHLKLQHDIDELNSRRASFEEWKEEEMKKLQKERKKLSQELKQVTSMKQSAQTMQLSNKKDKEQVEALKNQINKMQSEFKQKENTSRLLIEKLKKQIEELSLKKDNVSLILHQPQLTGASTRHNERARSNSKTATSTATTSSKMKKSKTGKIELKNKGNTLQAASNSNIYLTNPMNSKLDDEEDNAKEEKDESEDYGNRTSKSNNINTINYNSIVHLKEESNSKADKVKNVEQPQKPHAKAKSNKKQASPKASTIKKTIYSLTANEDPNERYDFVLPEKYHAKEYILLNQETSPDGKIIRLYNNDKREVIFQSGVRKEIYKDGYQIVYFSNGDLKQVFPDNKSVYYFKEAKTVQTTYGDGQQVFKFNNGQIEKHYTDGTKRITFPDGSIRYILKDGCEETYYSDGTIQKINKDNVIVIEHHDGLKEIKYPDGREKCIYPDEDEDDQGDGL